MNLKATGMMFVLSSFYVILAVSIRFTAMEIRNFHDENEWGSEKVLRYFRMASIRI